MADDDKLVKFDAAALTDRLRDRVRNSIADLVPDEAWDALIKRELDAFATDGQTKDYSGRPVVVRSVLGQVVDKMLREEIEQRVRTMFASPEWQATWDAVVGGPVVGEKVKAMCVEAGPQILNAWLSAAMQNAIMALQGQVGHPR